MSAPKEITVVLPELHPGQQAVADDAARFNVLMCGRRFGKTALGQVLAADPAIDGWPIGWFAPSYKYLLPAWEEMKTLLWPIKSKCSEKDMKLDLITGGSIECWSLKDNPDAGRSRKYKRVIVDEAGIVKNLKEAWLSAIRPTLSDLLGDGWWLGTPKGKGYFTTGFTRGQEGGKVWRSWRRGTIDNPYISRAEIEEAREEYQRIGAIHVFEQEYLGIPADDGGNPFDLKAIRKQSQGFKPGPIVAWGVDLAKSEDWTVASGLNEKGQEVVRERWQKIPWQETIKRLQRMIGQTPAMVDSTGVGDPIVEIMQGRPFQTDGSDKWGRPVEVKSQADGNITGFVFTGPSRQQLLEGLAVALQEERVTHGGGELETELEAFEYHFLPSGVRYRAPDGVHDDCVMAFALAVKCWTERTRTSVPVLPPLHY